MSVTDIEARLRASEARHQVLGLVGQDEVSAVTLMVRLRGQGFLDQEITDAVDLLVAEAVLVQVWGNALRRYFAA
jgi:hypothetical protein